MEMSLKMKTLFKIENIVPEYVSSVEEVTLAEAVMEIVLYLQTHYNYMGVFVHG